MHPSTYLDHEEGHNLRNKVLGLDRLGSIPGFAIPNLVTLLGKFLTLGKFLKWSNILHVLLNVPQCFSHSKH